MASYSMQQLPRGFVGKKNTVHRSSAGLLAWGLVMGCATGNGASSSTTPRDYVYGYDQLVGSLVKHTFVELGACTVTVKQNDTCVPVIQANLTADECGQVKVMVSPENLAVYEHDSSSGTGSPDGGAGGTNNAGSTLPGDTSVGGQAASPYNSAGGGNAPCDAGTEPQYVRQTASFVVNVANSEGVVSKYVFALDGPSLSAKTQELIELMRSIHAKYAPQ